MKYPVNRFCSIVLIALFTATLSIGCNKDDGDGSPKEEFEQFLEDEASDQEIPGMAVLIFDKETVLYECYLGESNRDQETALKSNDLFLMASISKTITATALLQLYDQGLFGLDDPINDHLSFPVNVPGQNTAITFRMLLTHTSGIADGSALDNQYYYGKDSPIALATFMESYLVPGGSNYNASENYHSFEPGTQHEYSNEGNALIGVLVESISGMGFNAYCKQHIFTPLEMNNTFWRLDEINQNIAVPYDYIDGDWDFYDHYTFTDYPNGGLRSTAQDLHHFAQALTQGGSYNGHQLLKSTTVSEMLKPQIPQLDGTAGWHLFQMNSNYNLWGHDGGEQGVSTIMAWNKDNGIGAIILSNQGEADLDEILEKAYLYGRDL